METPLIQYTPSMLFCPRMSVQWSTRGGLEILDQSATKVTVRSGNGTTYADKYSKYSNGELRLFVDRTDVASEDCECAQLCDPVARFYLYFKKRFDIDDNPINGPECANAGDTVTFSVEPWNSLMLYGDYDSYVWTVEPSDYVKEGSQFYSADHSSTTFTLKDGLVSVDGLKLTCKICSVTDDVNEKTLSDKPKKPTIYLVEGDSETLVSDSRICLPANATKMVLRISDYNPAFDYNLSVSGWRCSNLGDGKYSFMVAGGDNELKLQLNGGCGSQTFIYKVSRSLSDDLKVADNCFTPGDTVNLMFSGVGQSLDVRWSFADGEHNGWDIESGDITMPTAKVGTAPVNVLVNSAVCNVSESLPLTLYVPPVAPVLVDEYSYSCLDYEVNDKFMMAVKDDAATSSWTWFAASNNFKFTTAESSSKDGLSVVATPTYKSSYSTKITVTAVGYEGCADKEVSTSFYVSPVFAKPTISYTSDGCDSPGSTKVFTVSSSSAPKPPFYVWDFGGMVDTYGCTGYQRTDKKSLSLYSPGKDGVSVVSVRPYGKCNDRVASATTASDSVSFSHKFTVIADVEYDVDYKEYSYSFKVRSGDLDLNEINSFSWKIDGVEVLNKKFGSGMVDDKTTGDSICVLATFAYGDEGCVDTYEYHIVLSEDADNSIGNKSLRLTGKATKLKVFPNPVENVATVQMVHDGAYNINVYSKNGVLLLSEFGEGSIAHIDVSSLKPDLYVCVVEQSGITASKIFRIKR